MRLGGPVFAKTETPAAWAVAVAAAGYRAAYCPVGPETDDSEVRAYAAAAREADLVIAEVGAWCNPLAPDDVQRKKSVEQCRKGLDLADRIGARCCVNIAGSRGQKWDGPCAADLSEETFEMIVAVVRDIIDSVRPVRAFYALETMPWMYPDSADTYVRLIHSVDRKQFGVHLDPVNLVCSPRLYFRNGDLIRECFKKLGPHIRSCHAKDILLGPNLTVHLDEVRPGLGGLDYAVYLAELARCDADVPLMLEHMAKEKEYALAAKQIRAVARRQGIAI